MLKAKYFVLIVSIFCSGQAIAEWRFFASLNDAVIFLSEKRSQTTGCEGKKEASEQKLALNKWVILRELCYELDKDGNVKLTDPNKVRFFNTFTVSSGKFVVIPNEREREEAENRKIAEQNSRNLQEAIRQMNEQQRQQTYPASRAPLTCIDLGGGLTSCM